MMATFVFELHSLYLNAFDTVVMLIPLRLTIATMSPCSYCFNIFLSNSMLKISYYFNTNN